MTDYIGSGPYCYANSLAMVLGDGAPSPAEIEVLTGSPFGFDLLHGQLPLFDPHGWDPDIGLDDAIGLLGWECERIGAADGVEGGPEREAAAALERLRGAVKAGPVLAGPTEIGLLRHQPDMPGHPIESDHFVVVLDVDDDRVLFHDPHGYPYATLPPGEFLASWRAESIGYAKAPYTMRHRMRRTRVVGVDEALRAAVPGWIAWLRGRTDLPMPPGSLGGTDGVQELARQVDNGLSEPTHNHLVFFAVRVGARRLADAARVLSRLGLRQGSAIATRQARLVGSLQYDLVASRNREAAQTLEELAPTYRELADAICG